MEEEDCIRTATVVANTHVDLLTIDRTLFDQCLHGVVKEEMKVVPNSVKLHIAILH